MSVLRTKDPCESRCIVKGVLETEGRPNRLQDSVQTTPFSNLDPNPFLIQYRRTSKTNTSLHT